MAFIVKGMEMPKSCAECDFELHDEYECIHECPLIYKGYTNKTRMFARLDDCPLIEIPRDAKLVDANELLDKSEASICGRTRKNEIQRTKGSNQSL